MVSSLTMNGTRRHCNFPVTDRVMVCEWLRVTRRVKDLGGGVQRLYSFTGPHLDVGLMVLRH